MGAAYKSPTVSISGGAINVNVLNDYLAHKVGASAYRATPGTGGAAIVSPAGNVNGLILRTVYLVTSGADPSLYTGTSVPTSLTDLNVTRLAGMITSTNNQYWCPMNILIPAGQGLYYYTNGVTGTFWVTYDLL